MTENLKDWQEGYDYAKKELQDEIFRLKQELELIKSKSQPAWHLDLNEPIPKNHNQRMYKFGWNDCKREFQEKIIEIKNWLVEIKEFNAHDSAWIDETINKLNKLFEETGK